MKSYLDLLRHVMERGQDREDRTGVGTRGVFGYCWRHHLADGFPLLTTKKLHTKSIVHELLWFLRGETNVRSLQAAGVTIWDEWANENGDLGPVYGKQWRRWKTPCDGSCPNWSEIDQIATLVRELKANPFSRRHIVTAWNPTDIPHMKLPPCHTLWQCHVEPHTGSSQHAYRMGALRRSGFLNLHLYARSIDSFLGLPFNIASYAFLLTMLATVCDYAPGELIISFGDLHIYRNHFDQVAEQLSRNPRPLPTLRIREGVRDIDQFSYEDLALVGYDPHPPIKASVAV